VLFNALGLLDTPLPLIVPKLLATDAFFVFLMVQFMRGIPRTLDEAAAIDGCGPYRRFFHVVLPLTKPALVTTAVFSFIQTWNDFFSQLVYLNDLTNYTVPIGLRLFLDSSGQNAIAPMFAMSVLSLLPVFLFFLFFQRLIVDGINTSGIKG
jgi:multiple sugar transport system permease protein